MRTFLFTLATSLVLSMSAHAAAPKIKLGTFNAVTESDANGAAFELKAGGKAVVMPDTSYNPETPAAKRPEPKKVNGKWREVAGGIELSFGEYKDFLRFEGTCPSQYEHPCFVFGKSLARTFVKSPLKREEPYVNWDWKR